MKAILALVLLAETASASPVAVESIVRDRIGAALPEDLGVVDVVLPASLASLATEPDRVTIEMPRTIKTGRASAKVQVRGRSIVYARFSVSRRLEVMVVKRALAAGAVVTSEDVAVERRAVNSAAVPSTIIGSSVTRDLTVGSIIAKSDVVLAPALARGTQVTVEMRQGTVRVRGAGTLEAAARSGEAAMVRLAHTRSIVRGTLRGSVLVVGEL